MAKASREGVKFSGEKKPTLWKAVSCSSPCWQLPMGQARALTHPDDKTLSLFHSRESEGPWLFGGRAGSQPRLPVLLPWPQASLDNEQGWKGDLVLPVRSPGDSGLGALGL